MVLDEPAAETSCEILVRTDEIMISAGTLAEALIVAARRGVGPLMEQLGFKSDVYATCANASCHALNNRGWWTKWSPYRPEAGRSNGEPRWSEGQPAVGKYKLFATAFVVTRGHCVHRRGMIPT